MTQEPADVQQTFSNEHSPTVWRIIPSLEFLVKRWETMASQPRFRDVREAITEGVQNFKKWYQKVDETSDAYFICIGSSSLHLFTSSQLHVQQFLTPTSRICTAVDVGNLNNIKQA
jgi:hypothetical protein